MRYDYSQTPLKPHSYQHDMVLPASYIVVEPKKGHSTTFRIEGQEKERALADARRRGFKPLYVVNARKTKKP